MRSSSWLLGALLASSLAAPALGGGSYSKCTEALNPAECIARRAIRSFGLESTMVLDAVLRHGLVEAVPAKSSRLVRGVYGNTGQPDERMDSPEAQLLDSGAAQALRRSPPKSLVAAVSLVAAARRDADPFQHPIYLELARKAGNDPRIPALAIGIWIEIVGMSGLPSDFEVTHPGLSVIWDSAAARREQDPHLLADMAGTLAYLNRLMPQVQEYHLWYAQYPNLTPQQRTRTASQLARHFDLYDPAAALLEGLGEVIEGYDSRGVRSEVAAARLRKGYDAAAARVVADELFDEYTQYGIRFGALGSSVGTGRDALERSGAVRELRALGAECLRRAEALAGEPQAAEWFAAASDYYMRAGDRERAREIARRGLPYVPAAVRRATESYGNVDFNDPISMTRAAQGTGTSPVIALYRAGAIEEAVQTRYLSGKDRYLNAKRAGEKADPQWVIDDRWSHMSAIAHDAARAGKDFQQRAYDGLVRFCGKPLTTCFSETLRDIALVSAAMGDEERMKEALSAAARQNDKGFGMGWSALYIAGPWAHCEEVLRAARGTVSSSN